MNVEVKVTPADVMDENAIFVEGVGTVVGIKHGRQEAQRALFYAVERIAELERERGELVATVECAYTSLTAVANAPTLDAARQEAAYPRR